MADLVKAHMMTEGVLKQIKLGQLKAYPDRDWMWLEQEAVVEVYNDGRLAAPRQELGYATGRVEFTAPAEHTVVVTSLSGCGDIALLGGEMAFAVISGMANVVESNLLPYWCAFSR